MQLAPRGQTLPSRRVMPCSSSLAVQMSAHWVGVLEGGFSSTHCGAAVVPMGSSLGHGWVVLQEGEQKEPLSPVIVVFSLPLAQGPSNGFP